MKTPALETLVLIARATLQTHEGHLAIQKAVEEVALLLDDRDAVHAKLDTTTAELTTCREERAYYKAQMGTILVQLEDLEVEPELSGHKLPDSIAADLEDNEAPAPPRLVEDEPETGG